MLWDARGKSGEAKHLNQELENIKAQISKHYQYLVDYDSFVSAKKVYDRNNGFGGDIHSLMESFDIQIRVNTLKWLMYLAMDGGWIHKHQFKKFVCKPEYKKCPFLSEEDLQRVISVKLSYRRQQAIRDMFVFMCFSGLAHADLKELSYRNVHTDSDGNTWLVGNRVKTKAPYVVKLLPIAVELIEKYRGVNEFKVSPDRVFPVGEIGSMEDSLKRIGEKAGCSVRVSPHVGRHTFATLALSKGMPLETLQKVLGHKTIISTQVYAELINPKIGEDTDRMREKIGGMFRLAN